MRQNEYNRVLVTGAAGALGNVVALHLAERGFDVIAVDLNLPDPLSRKKTVNWAKVDLTCPASVKTLAKDIPVDILVHCAGGFRFAETENLSDEDFDYLVNLNLKSGFYLSRELLPQMKERNFGRMVFISSRATLQSGKGLGAYSATKAGLNQLTSALADEVKTFDITANALLPTVIDTPANRRGMPNSNFSDWVRPEQLAEIIGSLISSWGDPINGALIPVSGRL